MIKKYVKMSNVKHKKENTVGYRGTYILYLQFHKGQKFFSHGTTFKYWNGEEK